jgi:hypothetical protein
LLGSWSWLWKQNTVLCDRFQSKGILKFVVISAITTQLA